jgi:hypothetical protein
MVIRQEEADAPNRSVWQSKIAIAALSVFATPDGDQKDFASATEMRRSAQATESP